jgi:hypothetical protein
MATQGNEWQRERRPGHWPMDCRKSFRHQDVQTLAPGTLGRPLDWHWRPIHFLHFTIPTPFAPNDRGGETKTRCHWGRFRANPRRIGVNPARIQPVFEGSIRAGGFSRAAGGGTIPGAGLPGRERGLFRPRWISFHFTITPGETKPLK